MSAFLFVILSYVFGSIPFGLAVARKVKGIDIRNHGSGSMGATNVFRVVGKGWGILVFSLDTLKGYLAVKIPDLWLGDSIPFYVLILCGLASILGHTFPVWLGFRGGKGVATSLGVFLALAFLPTIMTFVLWAVVFAVTRIISLSSLAAAVCFPFAILIGFRGQPGFKWLLLMSPMLALLIFYTHRANLQRLLRGEEQRLF